MKRRVFRFNPPNAAAYFAFSLASLFLAALFLRALVVAAVFAAGAVYFAAEALIRLRKDPYDLRELRDIHDREEASKLSADADGSEDGVFCPYCSEVFPADLPTCPHCGRSVNT